MNHRVTPPGTTAKGRRAWLFLSILLPALASKVSVQNSSSPIPAEGEPFPLEPHQQSHPYLRFVAAPPLRFEDPAPPPDLSVRPPAGAPPKQKGEKDTSADVALPKPPPPPVAAPAQPVVAAAPKLPTGAPILPDDVQSQLRPEDFLPYFQYPGAHSNGVPVPPSADRPLPPSTATYQQQ